MARGSFLYGGVFDGQLTPQCDRCGSRLHGCRIPGKCCDQCIDPTPELIECMVTSFKMCACELQCAKATKKV